MRTLKRTQLETELELVRGLTKLAPGPFGPALMRLFDAGATEVQYVLSPAGDSFGVEVIGTGQQFAATVAAELGGLTVDSIGDRFISAVSSLETPTTVLELTLGKSPRLVAGLMVNHTDQVRSILERDSVAAPEIERVITNSGQVRAINLWAMPNRAVHWVVWSMGSRSSALGPGAELGERELFTGWVAGRPDLTWLRRDGLANLSLVDWLFEQGFRGDYAERLGRVHAQLEASAPERMRFAPNELQDTLTLHYRSKISW